MKVVVSVPPVSRVYLAYSDFPNSQVHSTLYPHVNFANLLIPQSIKVGYYSSWSCFLLEAIQYRAFTGLPNKNNYTSSLKFAIEPKLCDVEINPIIKSDLAVANWVFVNTNKCLKLNPIIHFFNIFLKNVSCEIIVSFTDFSLLYPTSFIAYLKMNLF